MGSVRAIGHPVPDHDCDEEQKHAIPDLAELNGQLRMTQKPRWPTAMELAVNRCFMILVLVLLFILVGTREPSDEAVVASEAVANKSQFEALNAKVNKMNEFVAEITKTMNGQHNAPSDCLDASKWYDKFVATEPWRIWSQGKQDSVLASLFEHLGTTNKRFVEFGYDSSEAAADSNSRLLNVQGWKGLLLDGGNENAEINLHKAMITPDNIVSLFDKYHVPREPDYVSIDLDSCDLWVFLALTKVYRPRVMTMEYNMFWPLGASKTNICKTSEGENYHWNHDVLYGASLAAIAKAADARGYALIWVEEGLDAFLVRKDLVCNGSHLPLQIFAAKTGFNKLGYDVPDDAVMDKWYTDY